MADQIRNFCEKCDEKLVATTNTNQKTLKCFNTDQCNKGLHYSCSSYTTNELQFLESNQDNVKWFCDDCKNKEMFQKVKPNTC